MSAIANGNETVEQNYECSDCNKSFDTERSLSNHKGQVHKSKNWVTLHINNGYERWNHYYKGESDIVAVHQLLAIADGESPSDVFAPDTDVHHTPIEHPLANLPGNVQVMDHSEHSQHHNPPIENDKLLEDLRRLADELGHSPTTREINEHGEYSYGVYYKHFGGLTEARKEAGLTTVDISHLQETNLIVDVSHLK